MNQTKWRMPGMFLLAALATVGTPLAAQDASLAMPPAENNEQARQIRRLVRQLNDDSAERRNAAEESLCEMAGTTTESVDRFLTLLPQPNEQMPLAVRERLTRIRAEVEDRAAKGVLGAMPVTLNAKSMPVWDALQEIEKQTGNRVVDLRHRGAGTGPTVTASFDKEPYWSAIDELLDQANLDVYTYAGEGAMAIVDRDASDVPRHDAAAYSGPFRIEATEIQAQRNLRKVDRNSLKIQLQVAWEPRLRPITISQASADVVATDEQGNELKSTDAAAIHGAEIPSGTQGTEIVLSFQLPPRSVSKIASLTGKLRALVPGRQAKFEFPNIAKAAGQSQRRGGVQVFVDAVRQNNAIWEIHMRLRLEEDNHALESHRGWAFQNLSYLVDEKGEPIDNAGLETTMQSQKEVGVAYFFDREEGLDGITWVYETPAAIVEMPVEYELSGLSLP